MKKLNKFYRVLLYLAPVVFFFSFWPAISFGQSDTMHYKITLVLVWLVVFDIVSLSLVFIEKGYKRILKYYWLLLFSAFATVSLFWSQNLLRGFFTVGVLWLITIAIVSILLIGKEQFDKKFKKNFLRIFFGSSVVVGVFCLVQCVLDLIGVSRETTLMCAGCTYGEFGFPHPNGFAIEPQFMGNLLLAPTILAGYYMLRDKKYLWLFLFLSVALFLTFSRGAIYAFILTMVLYTIVKIIQTKKWQAILIWPVIIIAFLFTLNLQGVFAAVSKTNDTYFTGVAKAINHLSLGVIGFDILNKDEAKEIEVKEDEAKVEETKKEEAAFDGYVESSTNGRIQITAAMINTWKQSLKNMLIGVGFGGAGVAMYEAGEMEYAGEVGQNYYASTLLETGLIGTGLFISLVYVAIKKIAKMDGRGVLLSLVFAYLITMMFFAGYINAVHIFIMPVLISMICNKDYFNSLRK